MQAPLLQPKGHWVSVELEPQAPAVQMGIALEIRSVWELTHTGADGGDGQAWQDVPHDATSSLETQRCPHACWPMGH
jgi:hypothetical protein